MSGIGPLNLIHLRFIDVFTFDITNNSFTVYEQYFWKAEPSLASLQLGLISILKFNNKLKGADLVMASHCHSTFRMVLVKLAVLPHSAGIVK